MEEQSKILDLKEYRDHLQPKRNNEVGQLSGTVTVEQ